MEIKHFENDLEQETAAILSKKINECKGRPIFILLSGGSSLGILPLIDSKVLGPHITITMLDERFSRDPKINSFLQIQNLLFYKNSLEAGVHFLSTVPEEGESLEESAEKWDARCKKWKQENPQGVVIATIGVGEDGHMAGMLPYPEDSQKFSELFEDQGVWMRGYDAKEKSPFPLRITSTMHVLKNVIDYGISFVKGKGKEAILHSVLKKEKHNLNECPALVIHEVKNLILCTDIKIS